MRVRRSLSALFSGAMALALVSPAMAQEPPPPTPVTNPPPFDLPAGTTPPDFSKGRGLGKASSDVSFACLGVTEQVFDSGSAYSYIADEVVIEGDASVVVVAGAAAGDLATSAAPTPLQGASASLNANGLLLQPFDVCASSAGSVLDSVVVGSDTTDPSAFGMADVDFHFEYYATFELEQGVESAAHFFAYTGTELEVLGLGGGAVEISADGTVVSAPEGLTVTDLSEGERSVFVVSGSYDIPGRLRYGSGVKNVVKTTFFAGGEAENLSRDQAEIVAGFAAADALDSVTYSIVSVDPNISFHFVADSDR